MEKANTKSAFKLVKHTSHSAAQWSSTRLTKEELREKIYDKTKASRKSPPKENKSPTKENRFPSKENRSPSKENRYPSKENRFLSKENRFPSKENKSPPKEKTKPQEFKLHTQERAVKRTMFNYAVNTKLYIMELQKKREEMLLKMIEEEEIRSLRKDMVPRAQLMPYFDRPFFPKRSSRPLTIPREPSFHNVNSTCWSCFTGGEFWSYDFQSCGHHSLKGH
ncbi:hypothetical protein L6164_033083 [Bauhinia variegata]|uniref:Uncharacterized protein n=1 Tax=Bauhinia variegata TaxID=167791 RepID=A0ACB9KQQ9_BAUVA|nr:hypothetical protein L6164_033083 [Bauhinia variegata]